MPMSTHVSATLIDGVFKTDKSVGLENRTCVNLTIEPTTARCAAAAAWQTLTDRLKGRPIHTGGLRYTRDQLHEHR